MKLSVIIPYYNGEKYIEKCLNSLLYQGFNENDYEIIIVDDGSSQKPCALLEFADKYKHIHYLYQSNQGPSAARNYGLKHATGNYIYYCDCDDYLESGVLQKLCKIAELDDLSVLHFRVNRIEPGMSSQNKSISDWNDYKLYSSGEEYINVPFHENLQNGISKGPYCYIVKRRFLEDYDLKFECELKFREDNMYYINMMLKAGKVGDIKVFAYNYLQWPTSIVHNLNNKSIIHNILYFIAFLKIKAVEFSKLSGFVAKLQREINSNSILVLLLSARTMTYAENCEIISYLKRMGIYPIRSIKDKSMKMYFILMLMNRPRLWAFICYLLHGINTNKFRL